MIVDRSRPFTVQIKECMIRQVDRRSLIGSRLILNFQTLPAGCRICYFYMKVTGESFFPIGRQIAKHQCGVIRLFGLPYAILKADLASMKGIGSVVRKYFVFSTIERECALADSVAYPSDQGTEIWLTGIAKGFSRLHSHYNVDWVSFLIGDG